MQDTTARTRTIDRDGHPLHVGDDVRYRGSVAAAYGLLCEVIGINSNGTMTLETPAGPLLRWTRPQSVAYAPKPTR